MTARRTRSAALSGLLAGIVATLLASALGAFALSATTRSFDAREIGWEVVSGGVGLLAGFSASRAAVAAPRAVRYAVALAGPGLLALASALTSASNDPARLWIAFALALAGAAAGAGAREALGRVTLRRAS